MERDAISTLTHTILSGHGKEGNKIESPVREKEKQGVESIRTEATSDHETIKCACARNSEFAHIIRLNLIGRKFPVCFKAHVRKIDILHRLIIIGQSIDLEGIMTHRIN